MSETQLKLTFDGPAMDGGVIDVNDLAPALLSVGELIQSANSHLNGKRAQVSVRVRATSHACFEIDLSLFQSLAESAKSLLSFACDHKDEITVVKDLTEIVFGCTGGMLGLVAFLKGRKPDKVEHKDGNVYVHIGDNVFVTSKEAIELAQNVEVREQARKAVSVLSKDGVDALRFTTPLSPPLEITKAQVGHFEYTLSEDEDVINNDVREMVLQVVSLSFKEDNKWRVTDGGDAFTVSIEDVDFLNKIANSEIAFSKNDYLKCRVRVIQLRTPKGLKIERRIVEMIEHTPAAQQLKLM
ncbi:MAG: hypothetical protein JXQ84_03955 [Rhodospirillaceae bacterium]|nr:hypothetical protein [Rhodospirillaceae bacterium]